MYKKSENMVTIREGTTYMLYISSLAIVKIVHGYFNVPSTIMYIIIIQNYI